MKTTKGFTIIDVIVGTALMLIIFLGIFGAYQLGMKAVGQSKNRITATAIANQQLEKIRNLAYDSVGVINGFPAGVLEASTSTWQNNVVYTINTWVDFVVDSADGISLPDDDCPNDYKKVKVGVAWSGRFPGLVESSTDIAPKNIAQECQTSGGILSVSVFDARGQMVLSPLIEVKDPVSGITLKTATPESGEHYFSLATSTYKVIVSKTSYSQERTYGADEIAAPEKPHPQVLEDQVSEISFSIDKLSSMKVKVRGTAGAGYPVIHGVTFNLRGAKIIGFDSGENPVAKYSQNQTTNGDGEILIPNLEWDFYSFSVITPDLDLINIESPPGTTTTQPISLLPDSSQEVRLILKSENSLLITVQNLETLGPIFSASTTLSKAGFSQNQYTDAQGQTYFIPLEQASYVLSVEAGGYLATSTEISVSGDSATIVKLRQTE